jgi:hypothetical protein
MFYTGCLPPFFSFFSWTRNAFKSLFLSSYTCINSTAYTACTTVPILRNMSCLTTLWAFVFARSVWIHKWEKKKSFLLLLLLLCFMRKATRISEGNTHESSFPGKFPIVGACKSGEIRITVGVLLARKTQKETRFCRWKEMREVYKAVKLLYAHTLPGASRGKGSH